MLSRDASIGIGELLCTPSRMWFVVSRFRLGWKIFLHTALLYIYPLVLFCDVLIAVSSFSTSILTPKELVSENEMLRARASKAGASAEVASDANIDHPKDGAAVDREAAESAPTGLEFKLGFPQDGEHPVTIPAEVTATRTCVGQIVNRRVPAPTDVDVDPGLKERASRAKRLESGGGDGPCPGAKRETGDEAMSTSVTSPRGVDIETTATELVDSAVRTPARERQVAVDPQAESLVFDKAVLCDLGAPEGLRASLRTLERRVEKAQKEVANLERLRGIERDEASSKETRLEDALRGAQVTLG